MYKIGDRVVYRQLSVCVVQGIEIPAFESDHGKEYYKLYPVFNNQNNTTIYVPVDSKDSLRSISSREEAENALTEAAKQKNTTFTAKKPPQLTAYYQDLLSSGELKKYLFLLKEIAAKEKTTKKLSEIDARFRNKTERLVCEEFAVIFDETLSSVKEKLYKTMGI